MTQRAADASHGVQSIIANALIFHERIAGMHEGFNPLLQVWSATLYVANPQIETLTAWDAI